MAVYEFKTKINLVDGSNNFNEFVQVESDLTKSYHLLSEIYSDSKVVYIKKCRHGFVFEVYHKDHIDSEVQTRRLLNTFDVGLYEAYGTFKRLHLKPKEKKHDTTM